MVAMKYVALILSSVWFFLELHWQSDRGNADHGGSGCARCRQGRQNSPDLAGCRAWAGGAGVPGDAVQ